MKKLLLDIGSSSLGDIIAYMPYIDKYRIENNIDVDVYANKSFAFLFENSYPNLNIVSNKLKSLKQDFKYDLVMTYRYNFKMSLQGGIANFLGYEDLEYIRPKIDSFTKDRPIKSKYVTFGVHSTSQLKYWNTNPDNHKTRLESTNWNDLCRILRKEGITPVSLSQCELFGNARTKKFNGLPKKAVKKIGLDLREVINYIQHSEFYIGPSSGLAWVAHALNKPVAMISNFTEDWNEFDLSIEDYKRITNKNVCHGCWHVEQFNKNDWEFCPRHAGTKRQFECHSSIKPEDVFNEIKDWI